MIVHISYQVTVNEFVLQYTRLNQKFRIIIFYTNSDFYLIINC